jgi:hypothetical protein
MASAHTFSRVERRPVTEKQPLSRSQKLAAEIDPYRRSQGGYALANASRQVIRLPTLYRPKHQRKRNTRLGDSVSKRIQQAVIQLGRRNILDLLAVECGKLHRDFTVFVLLRRTLARLPPRHMRQSDAGCGGAPCRGPASKSRRTMRKCTAAKKLKLQQRAILA